MPVKFLTSPLLSAPHAFFTRHGGISPPPYDSLNLAGSDDDPANIAENRRLALISAGFDPQRVSWLKQVHGTDVHIAQPGIQTGDALVTSEKNLPLAVSAADCYPILFHDPVHLVIGAAHAGWKGTLGRIAKHTIEAMIRLGAERASIRAAIGPGICRENYEVSEEVISQFRAAGFPESCRTGRKLDLLAANEFVLRESGIAPEHIWKMNRCTTEPDFFSHRRDKGQTGRMWAVIALN